MEHVSQLEYCNMRDVGAISNQLYNEFQGITENQGQMQKQ